MQCFRCDQLAVLECDRCGALYCDDHGDMLCERCLDPFTALPSFRVYRGSLLALALTAAFAVGVLLSAGSDSHAPGAGSFSVLSSNPTAASGLDTTMPQTSTPSPNTVTLTAQPGGTSQLEAQASPPTPATTVAPPARTYTVAPRDTLTIIANRQRPQDITASDYLQRIYQANPNLGPNSTLSVGQVIKLP
jgi:LysM repeat protein